MSKANASKRVLPFAQCHACDIASCTVSALCSLNLPPDVKKRMMDFSVYLERLATSRGGYSFNYEILPNGDIDYEFSVPVNSSGSSSVGE